MKPTWKFALALVAATTLATAALAQQRLFFGIATGGTGGTYYPLGGMLAQLISNKATVGGQKISATAEAAGASVGNAKLLGNKEIESAFVAADILDAAYNGSGQFDKAPLKNLRALGALYPETVQLITRADMGINSVRDLKGKSVSSGAPGSGQYQLLTDLLKVHGMTRADVKEDLSSFTQAVDKIKDGNLNATLITAGVPTAAVTDFAQSHALKVIPLTGPEIAELRRQQPYYAERAAAGQHLQGPDGRRAHAGGDVGLGHPRSRARGRGLRSDQGAVREHRHHGPGARAGQEHPAGHRHGRGHGADAPRCAALLQGKGRRQVIARAALAAACAALSHRRPRRLRAGAGRPPQRHRAAAPAAAGARVA